MTRLLATAAALAGLALLAAPPPAGAQSLFKKDQEIKAPDPREPKRPAQHLFNDPVAERRQYRKHDIVYILILEATQSSTRTGTTVTKETEIEAELSKWIRIQNSKDAKNRKLLPALGNVKPSIDAEIEYSRTGTGQVKRDHTFKDQIAAEVLQVLPNGNLVLEARKERQIDDDSETIVLTGVVRGEDVSPRNTVTSAQIARLAVRYIGKGTTYNAQKAGLLSGILEKFWPF